MYPKGNAVANSMVFPISKIPKFSRQKVIIIIPIILFLYKDLESPLMSTEARKELNNPEFCTGPHTPPVCLAAADIAGSMMSKV